MANVTIPNLTSATTITPSTDLMVLEQTEGTRKATLSQIFTSSATSGSGLGITSGGVYIIKSGLDSDISDINTLLGNTSIASIGDGTVTGAVSKINSDLTDLTTLMDKTCTFTNIASSSSRYRCNIIPISKNLGLCVLKATLVPTTTSITYTIPKSTYGAEINAIMAGLANVGNVAISLGQNGTAGEMFTGTRAGLTANAAYVIDTCYVVAI